MIKNKNIAEDAKIAVSKIDFLANGTVNAKATTTTLTRDDFNTVITNTGATGTIVLTLPDASVVKGKVLKVQLTVAQIVSLSPIATDAIYLGGNGVVNKDLSIAGVIGNYADIVSDGTSYLVTNYSGVLTKEA